VRNNGFCYDCRCVVRLPEPCGPQPCPAEACNIRLTPGMPRRLPPEFPKTHHSKETANPFRPRKEHSAARSTYSPIIQIFRFARHDIFRRHPYSRPGWG